jgi:hypothetical protein
MTKKKKIDDEVCLVLRIALIFNEMVGKVVRGRGTMMTFVNAWRSLKRQLAI